MGIIGKGAKCNVSGCDNDGIRSLNTRKIEEAGLRVSTSNKKQHFVRSIIKNGKRKQKVIDP